SMSEQEKRDYINNWKKDLVDIGLKVKDIKFKRKISPFYDFFTLLKLYKYFRKEKFDIVHTHNPKPGLLGQLAARLSGTPIIVNTIHGFYFDENSSPKRRRFYIFIEKISAMCSDLIVFKSQEDLETAIKEKICGPEKCIHIVNGIDLDRFNPYKFSKELIDFKKEKIGITNGHKVIGIVARLVAEKGYLDLFEALKNVLKNNNRCTLLVVGPEEPDKKDAIDKNIIKKYDIENNVIFLGEKTDVEELYSLMDIFVLPSHREGLPISVIEAMAMERSIIVTDIRGCREEIDNGVNGIIIPRKDPKELEKAINHLLSNPEEAEKLGKAARQKAIKEFDENLVFEKLKNAYADKLK
ncbi:MAG TPA: glycosyltransferase family 4 protein, partial [Candidatus Staskawiczbacteria bacterium]|nr:glycosyltransferase family 4 protein [Candidatus Staskawiczbacteria bacterium]